MRSRISILLVLVMALNTLIGTGAGAASAGYSISSGGTGQSGALYASTATSLNMGTISPRNMFAALGNPVPVFSPVDGSLNVPVDTRLEVEFDSEKVRTNGNPKYTISRDLANYTEKIDVSITQDTYADSIVLTPPANLQYNTRYTISIPADALMIGESNGTASPELSWSFTTASSAAAQLAVSSLSPTNGSGNVGLSINPVITFNRNIRLNPLLANGGITLKKMSSNTIVPVSVAANQNKVTITPASSLEAGTNYYIEIAGNGICDAQNNSLYFAGFSGTSGWSFQTVAGDKTAPVLQNAAMYSNTAIRLQYNERLKDLSNLPVSSFTVTVNGETRRISSTTTSGEYVYVYLETGVAVGQNIVISYTGSGSQAIQDEYGNLAASFSSRTVTSSIDSVMPKPKDGYTSGSSVTLVFSETLKSPSSYAYQQFTVTVNGSYRSISSQTSGGSSITLYLSNYISNGDVVKVSYSPGSYPLQNTQGLNIPEFNDYYVRNSTDNIAPVFESAEGSGNKITLNYNEALRTSPLPIKSQFSVLVNNLAVYVTNVEIVSDQVILTLASSFTKDQNVTVSYVSGTGGIADLNGTLAGYINLQPVTYSSVVEGVRSISITGDTITLVFNSTLRPVSVLPTNQFYVYVDSVSRSILSASANSNTVTLKLSSAVSAGQIVSLSYTSGSSPLYDSLGNLIKSFSNASVQNLTTGQSSGSTNGIRPDFITEMSSADFGVGGYLLNTNTAQTANSRSKYGENVTRYQIDLTKLQTAIKYLTDSNIANGRLVFEVPSTEKAAEVVIPINPLMDMYSRGKTGSIAVKHNSVIYDLPMEKVPYSEITRALNAGSLSSANLTIQIETLPNGQMPSLSNTSGARTTPVASPVQINLTASNGVYGQTPVAVAVPGEIYFRTMSATTDSSKMMLVKYDLTAGTAAFVPSKMTVGASTPVFRGKVNGSNLIIGPATGNSYFTDIVKHWAEKDITELGNKLIVNARSGNNFQPEKSITRAEFATFIARGLGLEGDETSAQRFRDVTAGSAISKYIGAAAKAGIINGNSDGTFKPNSNITREQMALMMVRAMDSAGYSSSTNNSGTEALSRFKDAAKIQSKEIVARAVTEGIIQGITTSTFQPKGSATRAQAAVMLKRVLNKLGYI